MSDDRWWAPDHVPAPPLVCDDPTVPVWVVTKDIRTLAGAVRLHRDVGSEAVITLSDELRRAQRFASRALAEAWLDDRRRELLERGWERAGGSPTAPAPAGG